MCDEDQQLPYCEVCMEYVDYHERFCKKHKPEYRGSIAEHEASQKE